jgi:general secretion pathway protein M
MIALPSLDRYLTRPSLSGLIYGAVVVGCCLTTLFMLTDIVELYSARNASLEMLSRFDGRNHAASAGRGAASQPQGSPFLEGQTVTVASAALLQRITSIITNAGGTVVSSEMQQQGARSKDGYVTAIANCELGQEALQRVLHDIEAGSPFLFIDQLVVQTPSGPGEVGRLRVLLGVAGLWPGEK